MYDAARATNTNLQSVQEYYKSLSQIPGALDKNIGNVTALNATLSISKSVHRDAGEVIKDMSTAYNNLGITGETSLNFVARMSDLASKLKVNFNDLKTAIQGTIGSFKGIADANNEANDKMAIGIQQVYGQYVGALKETGMTGEHAATVVENMTKSISNMTLAQKAFLSQQTGGSGGLLGAVQIEKMLREGNYKEVFEKAKSMIQDQMGDIVTQEEALQDEGMATRFIEQRTKLMQNPILKNFVGGSESDATRVMEMFSKMDKGEIKEQDYKEIFSKTTQERITQGENYAAKTYNAVNDINTLLKQSKFIAQTSSVDLFERRFALGTGSENNRAEGADERTRVHQEYSKNISKIAADNALIQKPSGLVQQDMLSSLVKNTIPLVKSIFTSAGGIEDDMKNYYRSIYDKRGPEDQNLNKDQFIQNKMDFLKNLNSKEFQSAVISSLTTKQDTSAVAPTAISAVAIQGERGPASRQPQNVPEKIGLQQNSNQQVNVKVDVYCKSCNNKMEYTHTAATNTATNQQA